MQEVIRGKVVVPRRTVLYGRHGIGKSTWASHAPKPLFLTLEDGLSDIGVDRTPVLGSTTEVARWLIDLASREEKHEYRTVVIDSIDWLERLIWDATAREAEKKSIEDFGYGKGYQYAMKRWDMLLDMLDDSRRQGMNIVLLAHAKVEKFSPPDADPYDRWGLDIHKAASALIQEWADEVLFADLKVATISRDDGFGQTRTRAINTGDRVVHTTEAATHAAKRRIQLPDQLALDWSEYQKHWPVGSVPAGNIDGVVVDGSSKKKKEVVA